MSDPRHLLAAAMTALLVGALAAAVVGPPFAAEGALQWVLGGVAATALAVAWLGSTRDATTLVIAFAPALAFLGVTAGACACGSPEHGDPAVWLGVVGALFGGSIVIRVLDGWLARRAPPPVARARRV